MPIVRYGTEDHTSVAQSLIQRSGHAQSSQSCFAAMAAMANTGRNEVVNRFLVSTMLQARPTFVRIGSASTIMTALRTGELSVSKQSIVQSTRTMVWLFRSWKHLYARPPPRTVADLRFDLVTGSSGSLSRSSLSTLPAEGSGVTPRSRFSAVGSEAGYSETIDGDYSDFGEAFAIYRS